MEGADAEIWEFSESFPLIAAALGRWESISQSLWETWLAITSKLLQFNSICAVIAEWLNYGPSVLVLGVELSRQKTLTGVGSLDISITPCNFLIQVIIGSHCPIVIHANSLIQWLLLSISEHIEFHFISKAVGVRFIDWSHSVVVGVDLEPEQRYAR